MIIKPKIRGFICTTTHPTGCEVDVQNQINYVKKKGGRSDGPEKVLIIGASGGYGLASRISASFGYGAASVGVFLERPPQPTKTGSPGWYRTAAFSRIAEKEGIYSANVNGDAFSKTIKHQVCDLISRDLGQVDLVVYSLAAPSRTLSDGEIARSTLKPIGSGYDGVTVDLNTKEIRNISLEAASDAEILDTVKVIESDGDEDSCFSNPVLVKDLSLLVKFELVFFFMFFYSKIILNSFSISCVGPKSVLNVVFINTLAVSPTIALSKNICCLGSYVYLL